VFTSFKQLVVALWSIALIVVSQMGLKLEATIGSGFVPESVEIKLIKELDMNANSLSKLPTSRSFGRNSTDKQSTEQKREFTNLAKQCSNCGAKQEKVYSFKQLVVALWSIALIVVSQMGLKLGRPHTFATHSSGTV
jgi:uncharacterized protein YdbL (DUF1318 family)